MKARSPYTMMAVIALALIGVAVAVYFLFSAGGWDAAKYLPQDTILYLKCGNVSDAWKEISASGANKQLLARLEQGREESFARVVGACEKKVGRFRSLHLSFHGAVERQRPKGVDFQGEPVYVRHVLVRVLAIADLGKPATVEEFLPPDLMRHLRPTDKIGQVQIYELDEPSRQQADTPLSVASLKGKLLVSTDRALLEDVASAIQKGTRPDSLAEDEGFRKIRRGQREGDVSLYVSVPGFLRARRRLPAWCGGTAEAPTSLETFVLRDVKYVSHTMDYSARTGTLRVLMDTHSPVYQLAAQPAKPKGMADAVPKSAVFFAVGTVGSGKKTWRTLDRLFAEYASVLGGQAARQLYTRSVTDLAQELDVDLDDAASLVEAVGYFLDRELGGASGCVVIKVNDTRKVRRLLRRLTDSRFSDSDRSLREYREVTVNVVNAECAWAIVGGCVLMARPPVVEAAIDARLEGRILSTHPKYRALTKILPKRSGFLLYFNAEAAAQSEFSAQEWEALPRLVREHLRELAVGACLSARQGVVDVKWAQTKRLSPSKLLSGALAVMAAWAERRPEAPTKPPVLDVEPDKGVVLPPDAKPGTRDEPDKTKPPFVVDPLPKPRN